MTRSWHYRDSSNGCSLALVAVALAASACALIETGPDDVPGRPTPDDFQVFPQRRTGAPVVSTAVEHGGFTPSEPAPQSDAGPALSSSAPAPAAPSATTLQALPPSSCMPGMLEVKGLYCTDVKHRCIKGGRTHTKEETDEPEPYYCDAYQPGYAQCLEKEVPKHFCIDTYEYPNEAGAIPMVMVTWYEARRLCEAQNKRLCDDDEWTLACEGPERFPYPHGWARDRTACNIDHLWIQPNDGILANRGASPGQIETEVNRLSKRVPSGSSPRCKSPYGVMDMTGNVDEWTVNVTLDGKPYSSAFKGGHWISGARNRCRAVTVSHDENTFYYSEGFRCCANLGATAPGAPSAIGSTQ